CCCLLIFFFFQAEDGIRDFHVTGVQTCALPILGADGANSQVRQMAGIGVHAWQYQQSCMLITVQCENAPSESTWQHFTPNGPHRSEERRVGKEGRSRWSPYQQKTEI